MIRSEKKRVLLVDDNDCAREILTYHLTSVGYDVCEAFDGIDALHLMCRRRFDGVITDYHMPRLNGIQLWAISRELWPGLPVVLLSADAVPEAGNLLPGQPTWIRKPYGTAELLRVVGAAFESASVPKGEDVFGTS